MKLYYKRTCVVKELEWSILCNALAYLKISQLSEHVDTVSVHFSSFFTISISRPR